MYYAQLKLFFFVHSIKIKEWRISMTDYLYRVQASDLYSNDSNVLVVWALRLHQPLDWDSLSPCFGCLSLAN
mgnify:CR=1 FL=1